MPVTVKFDPSSQTPQAQVIADVTLFADGVMTSAMLALLTGGAPSLLKIYVNDPLAPNARPDPTMVGAVAGVKAAVIWNASDNQPNFSDGVNWYDAAGNLT